MARCHVSLEKSSKNYIRCESEPSQAALIASPLPHLLAKRQVFRANFPRGEEKSAKKRRRGNSPWRLATLRGEGGVICRLISFDNGSLVLRPIQHEGGQWYASPFLFNQDLPNSVDYTAFYRQHLCENEESRPQQHTWNSKALFFPAQIYCCRIVYIFNILCGLKVIDSRHLQ